MYEYFNCSRFRLNGTTSSVLVKDCIYVRPISYLYLRQIRYQSDFPAPCKHSMESHEGYHVSAGAPFDSRLSETSCRFLVVLVSFSCSEVLWLVVDSTWSHSFSLNFSRDASLGAPHPPFPLRLPLFSSLIFSSLLFLGIYTEATDYNSLDILNPKKRSWLNGNSETSQLWYSQTLLGYPRVSLQDTRQLSRFSFIGSYIGYRSGAYGPALTVHVDAVE